MTRLFRWLADRAQYKAQVIELSQENRRLAAENHALGDHVVAVAEELAEAKEALGLLRVEFSGLQMRFHNAREEAAELRVLARKADDYIAELEAEQAVLKARRPQVVA